MINTTDLSEFEVLLPGTWVRKDSGDTYSFTTDGMQLRDERLYKQLYITYVKDQQRQSLPYALTIEDDYCGLLAGDEKFIINSIAKHPDGSMDMEWKDKVNTLIFFHRDA
jgi:hypothetical protein